MKRLIIIATTFSGLLLLNACKKYVDIAPPRTSLVSDLVFTDGKTAESALTGIYSDMNSFNSSFANADGNFLPGYSADEFHPSSSSPAGDEFKENGLTPGNMSVSGLWSEPYSLIYQANAVIAGLTTSKTVPEAKSRQLMGEAKFLRAFFYFYLVNYFGDVPLIQNTDFLTNTNLPRENSALVYDAIVKDLTEAQVSLADDYPVADRVRVNKAAATALLARVYLYRGQWAQAEAEASKVLTNPRYLLSANLDNVFLRSSTEAIWQLQAVNTSTAGPVNTWEGYSIIPTNATTVPGYVMYPNFPASFESPTDRRMSWIKSYTPAAGGTTVYYPFKYKVRIGTVTEYSMVLRKAEQFLIRAEARAQQSNLSGAKADLDSIRLRAGLPVLAATLTKEQTLLATERERKVELFLEWGHRWFDLRRTGRSLAVLGPIKPGLTVNDLYYPIPLDALLTNTKLVQNLGY